MRGAWGGGDASPKRCEGVGGNSRHPRRGVMAGLIVNVEDGLFDRGRIGRMLEKMDGRSMMLNKAVEPLLGACEGLLPDTS